VFGRVRSNHTVEEAQSQLATAASALRAEYPESYPRDRAFRITATPLIEELTTGARTALWVVFGTGAFLLLIVCANVANLTLARALNRDRDLALMTALGAKHSVIARQMLIESTLLSLAGGAVGVALALATRGMLADFAARFSARSGDVAIDAPVLLFALAASIGTGLLLGAVPAWPRKRDLARALREGGQKGSVGGMRARSALVIGQVALSFVLLIGAGLMLRSLAHLQSVESGFDASRVLSMRLDLDFSRYTAVGRARAGLTDSGPSPLVFWNRLLDELPQQRGVLARALAANVPFGGGLPQLQFAIRGREAAATAGVTWNIVSEDYIQTTGMRLLSGRDFTAADRQGTPPVALVSNALAREHWGRESPIGSFIATNAQSQNWFEVVGVVSDVRPAGPAGPETPLAYIPLRQAGSLGSTLLVKTEGDPTAAFAGVRDLVRRIDPNQPVAFVQTLGEARDNSVASQRLTTTLLALLASLALLISAAGIAGVMAYAVAQRTREIGIRLALGATPGDVRWMVLRHALMLIGAGVVLGVGGALALSRFIAGLLFEPAGTDLLTYGTVALLFAAVGAVAAAAPALRSSRVDPLRALRAE
jgi:predicted permease